MRDLTKTVEALNRHGFLAEIVHSEEKLSERLREIFPEGALIARGGSMTVEQLGIVPQLEQAGYRFCRAGEAGAQVLLTGTNAVTEDGKLVNTDGTGNRVASMIYGMKTVAVIVGKNKVVPDLEAALLRIQTVAAPANAKRLHRNTPCVETGRCMDCDSPDRVCRATVIQTNPSRGVSQYVFFVNRDLGL